MPRTLLLLSSRPLDDSVRAVLEGADWAVEWVPDTRQARRELEAREVLVGLFVLWPEDPERHTVAITETVEATPRVRWIGGLDRGRLSTDTYLALATEHLYDFVSLPLDGERLAVILGHAYGMAELDRLFLAQQEADGEGEFGMLGTSPAMRELFDTLRQAAASDAPVVITGETGTGKETAARAIHAASARAERPFVAVNCASVPTSQGNTKIGSLQTAGEPAFYDLELGFGPESAGGTLFLDCIADLPPAAQARLLQLIDTTAAPGEDVVPWDGARMRLICASDAELAQRVREGRFRADLFYRLHVLAIRVPSLRERGDDVWALAKHFLDQFRRRHTTRALGFNRDALAVLACHDWPGNLRELRNRVHQAALYGEGPYLTPTDLELERRSPNRVCVTLQEAREDAERDAIASAVRRNRLNMTRAADELGVSRMTLYRLLHKHGIDVDR